MATYVRGKCLLTPLIEKYKSTPKLTQKEVAKRINTSPRMISHYAAFDGKGNGKPMSPEVMYSLQQEFGWTPDMLYEWKRVSGQKRE